MDVVLPLCLIIDKRHNYRLQKEEQGVYELGLMQSLVRRLDTNDVLRASQVNNVQLWAHDRACISAAAFQNDCEDAVAAPGGLVHLCASDGPVVLAPGKQIWCDVLGQPLVNGEILEVKVAILVLCKHVNAWLSSSMPRAT